MVNVSSLNGIMAQSGLRAYCGTKFGVRGFTEVLRTELLTAKHPVGVTVVHPGGIKTNITANAHVQNSSTLADDQQSRRAEAYDEKLFKTTADEAATRILDAVVRNRGRVLIAQATWVDRLVRAAPSLYPWVVARWERKTFS